MVGEPGCYVDFYAEDLSKVRKGLSRALGKRRHCISPPERSPGSCKDWQRIRFHVAFPANSISHHDLGGLFAIIADAANSDGLMMAREDIFHTGRALILDLTHTTGIREAIPLCSDILWLSNRAALCLTDFLPAKWEAMLRLQFEEHPEEIISAVRPLPSSGNSLWATCPTTRLHANAMAKHKYSCDNDPVSLNINLRGPHVFAAMESMRGLMNSIKSCQVSEIKAAGGKLEAGQWSFNKAGQFGDIVGNIRMVVDSEATMKAVKKEIAGRSFKVGGADLIVEVTSVSELALEGNNSSRRAAERRSRP